MCSDVPTIGPQGRHGNARFECCMEKLEHQKRESPHLVGFVLCFSVTFRMKAKKIWPQAGFELASMGPVITGFA